MKRILLSGFMLMSFFFGAGNLIYAPAVGLAAGSSFWQVMVGFVITASFIPLLTLVGVSISGDSSLSFAGRVSKPFGYFFATVIMFSIGPLFGIPRVANTAYEISIKKLLPLNPVTNDFYTIQSFFGYTHILVFFGVAFILVLYGRALLRTVGAFLSPALVVTIVLLVGGYLLFGTDQAVGPVAEKYALVPTGQGALDGYGTLDAIAAVGFAALIIEAMYQPGMTAKQVTRQVIEAGVLAVILLSAIYLALGALGNKAAHSGFTEGADLLVYAAQNVYGYGGLFLFAVIVFLACLTTCVGLLSAISTFCSKLLGGKKIVWLVGFTLSSAAFSIQGLSEVIKTSIPMIYFTYPLTIALTVLTAFNVVTHKRAYVYRYVGLLVGIYAVADGYKFIDQFFFTGQGVDLLKFVAFGEWNLRDFLTNYNPFGVADFGWTIPFAVGVVIGLLHPAKEVNHLLLDHDGYFAESLRAEAKLEAAKA